jgi:intracellular multiplication protein IcmJ
MPLGVARTGDRKRLAEVARSQGFASFKQSLQERDQHCCALCSFEAKKYQDIAPKPGVPAAKAAELREQDWITLCQFCAQAVDVGIAAHMKSGVLIWLPEISQEELNHIARAIYVARVSQGPLADAARRVMESLMKRREAARERLGTDDPTLLVTVLSDYLEDRHVDGVAKKLEGVRLYPLDRRIIKEGEVEFNQFPQILAYWRSREGPFGDHLPGAWLDHYLALTEPREAA